MELLTLTDVYGRTHYVAKADWERGQVLTPLRFKTGRRFIDVPQGLRPRGGDMIHCANVAQVSG